MVGTRRGAGGRSWPARRKADVVGGRRGREGELGDSKESCQAPLKVDSGAVTLLESAPATATQVEAVQ